MTYLVIAYPELAPYDYEWIQSYREENDSRYFSVVKPHITLVFAMSNLDKDDFVSEVRKQATGFRAFKFEIRVATINQDDSGEYFHEFLVPDKGYSDVVKLHDKLYADKFAPSLRYDLDFIPHIGVGNSDDAQVSKHRVDEINSRDILITGKVVDIDVVAFEHGTITTVDKILL